MEEQILQILESIQNRLDSLETAVEQIQEDVNQMKDNLEPNICIYCPIPHVTQGKHLIFNL